MMPWRAPVTRPAEDHALDQQVRRVRHDVAVLDRARLALVGVADDVLRVARRVAHELPLHAGGKAGAAQAPQAARLEGGDERVGVTAGGQLADGAVPLAGPVGIDVQLARITDDRIATQRGAGGRRGDGVHQRVARHARHHHVVDRAGRRAIATAQAGGRADDGAGRGRPGHALLRLGEQRGGAAPVAREIVADQHVDGWRRRGAKVRVEAHHALDLIEGRAGTLGQLVQRRRRDVAVRALDRAQLLHHGRAAGHRRVVTRAALIVRTRIVATIRERSSSCQDKDQQDTGRFTWGPRYGPQAPSARHAPGNPGRSSVLRAVRAVLDGPRRGTKCSVISEQSRRRPCSAAGHPMEHHETDDQGAGPDERLQPDGDRS